VAPGGRTPAGPVRCEKIRDLPPFPKSLEYTSSRTLARLHKIRLSRLERSIFAFSPTRSLCSLNRPHLVKFFTMRLFSEVPFFSLPAPAPGQENPTQASRSTSLRHGLNLLFQLRRSCPIYLFYCYPVSIMPCPLTIARPVVSAQTTSSKLGLLTMCPYSFIAPGGCRLLHFPPLSVLGICIHNCGPPPSAGSSAFKPDVGAGSFFFKFNRPLPGCALLGTYLEFFGLFLRSRILRCAPFPGIPDFNATPRQSGVTLSFRRNCLPFSLASVKSS